MALILALLAITVLLALVVQFTTETAVDIAISRNAEEIWRARYATRGAQAIVKAILRHDAATNGERTSLAPDIFRKTFEGTGGMEILLADLRPEDLRDSDAVDDRGIFVRDAASQTEITIEDEERKVPLNALLDDKKKDAVRGVLTRLVVNLGYDKDMADRIADFIDADQDGPGESGAKNAPLLTVNELLAIEGVDSRTMYELLYGKDEAGKHHPGLAEFATAWSTGAIDINTARIEVLRALDEKMDADKARAIVTRREQQPFQKVEEIKEVPGLQEVFVPPNPQPGAGPGPAPGTGPAPGGGENGPPQPPVFAALGVKSDTFSARIVRRGGSLETRIFAVFRRKGESGDTDVLLWEEVGP